MTWKRNQIKDQQLRVIQSSIMNLDPNKQHIDT